MALLHKATVAPSKLELLTAYLPTVSGLDGLVGANIELIGAYRFDDPAGAVGIETHIVRGASGATLHIPVTYRSEPLTGADADLIATTEHSVLGQRWVYNAAADPVYVSELLKTILTGASQVEQYFDEPDGRTYREPTALVNGSGTPGAAVPTITSLTHKAVGTDTVITTGAVELVVRHAVDSPAPAATETLSGTWSGVAEPTVLASIR